MKYEDHCKFTPKIILFLNKEVPNKSRFTQSVNIETKLQSHKVPIKPKNITTSFIAFNSHLS